MRVFGRVDRVLQRGEPAGEFLLCTAIGPGDLLVCLAFLREKTVLW